MSQNGQHPRLPAQGPSPLRRLGGWYVSGGSYWVLYALATLLIVWLAISSIHDGGYLHWRP